MSPCTYVTDSLFLCLCFKNKKNKVNNTKHMFSIWIFHLEVHTYQLFSFLHFSYKTTTTQRPYKNRPLLLILLLCVFFLLPLTCLTSLFHSLVVRFYVKIEVSFFSMVVFQFAGRERRFFCKFILLEKSCLYVSCLVFYFSV